MRILWASNAAFTGTGYGVGTKQAVKGLQAAGHEVAVLAYYGLQGAELEIDGIQTFSPRSDQWGNDTLEDYFKYFGADITLIHRDIWVNDPGLSERLPTAAWFPIDSSPVPNIISERMAKTRWLATMSRWAASISLEAGYAVEYVPHSFDPEVFKYGRHPEFRKALVQGIPTVQEDSFLILIVAANKGFPSRKGFPEMFRALAEFMRRHDDAYVHVHSLVTSEQGGPDLQLLAKAVGIPLQRMSILNPFMFFHGVDPEVLAQFYQMSDVLLNTSYGEGFGIPILEAQACGTPVITTDFSSMPEITWHGKTVGGHKMMTPLYTDWMVPDVEAIVAALEAVYAERNTESFRQTGQDVARWLSEEFTDQAVYCLYWEPWIAKIQADLDAGKPGIVTLE